MKSGRPWKSLIHQGKILYVGSSNFAGWHIARACETASRRGLMGLVSEQSKYSLAARMVELEVLPACRAYGVGVIPWSPLDGGLLGGVLQKPEKGRAPANDVQKRLDKMRPQLQAWEDLCNELGHKPADVALAWLIANPAVTAPIIGPRTMDQLTGAQWRWISSSTRPRICVSTRSGPAPAAKPPKPTPGKRSISVFPV